MIQSKLSSTLLSFTRTHIFNISLQWIGYTYFFMFTLNFLSNPGSLTLLYSKWALLLTGQHCLCSKTCMTLHNGFIWAFSDLPVVSAGRGGLQCQSLMPNHTPWPPLEKVLQAFNRLLTSCYFSLCFSVMTVITYMAALSVSKCPMLYQPCLGHQITWPWFGLKVLSRAQHWLLKYLTNTTPSFPNPNQVIWVTWT